MLWLKDPINVKVCDTSYRWNKRHLRGTMEIQDPDVGVSDPVCVDEDECTISRPVTHTTVMAEHKYRKPNVKMSVHKSHQVRRLPDRYGE